MDALFAVLAATVAVSATAMGDGYSRHRTEGGRTYFLYKPEGVSENAPLVLNIHCWFCDAAYQSEMSELDAEAEERGWLVAYPQGWYRSFGAGPECCFPASAFRDDVKYMRQIVEDVVANHGADARRVYSTGYSNGSYMGFRLATDLSHMFAAVGGSAGANPFKPESMVDLASPSRPVPVIHFHGTLDTTADFGDGVGAFTDWMVLNNCNLDESPLIETTGAVQCRTYSSCDPQADGTPTSMKFCKVDGVGHDCWPGSDFMNTNYDVNASAMMLDFFSQFALTAE